MKLNVDNSYIEAQEKTKDRPFVGAATRTSVHPISASLANLSVHRVIWKAITKGSDAVGLGWAWKFAFLSGSFRMFMLQAQGQLWGPADLDQQCVRECSVMEMFFIFAVHYDSP